MGDGGGWGDVRPDALFFILAAPAPSGDGDIDIYIYGVCFREKLREDEGAGIELGEQGGGRGEIMSEKGKGKTKEQND